MRSCNASPTPLARFGNKTTDISAFEITATGALEAEPDRALQELAIIARRLESPAVRAQIETMVQRLAAEPAVQAEVARRLGGDLIAGPDDTGSLVGGGDDPSEPRGHWVSAAASWVRPGRRRKPGRGALTPP